jgi:hypothetical protein
MQGLIEKQTKNRKTRFFAVFWYTAKDQMVTLPCAGTRQSHHVAPTCAIWQLLGLLEEKLCRAP